MNSTVSTLFHELVTVINHDTTSPRVEVLAADIAARVGSMGSVCVDSQPIRHEGNMWIQGGIRKFLSLYGLHLRVREAAGFKWLFIQQAEPLVRQYGNRVIERFLDGQVAA